MGEEESERQDLYLWRCVQVSICYNQCYVTYAFCVFLDYYNSINKLVISIKSIIKYTQLNEYLRFKMIQTFFIIINAEMVQN